MSKYELHEKVLIKGMVIYLQDFNAWEGHFGKGKIFTVKTIIHDSSIQRRYILTAPKYGEENNYGNGAICVNEKDILPVKEEITNILEIKSLMNKYRESLGIYAPSVEFWKAIEHYEKLPTWLKEQGYEIRKIEGD